MEVEPKLGAAYNVWDGEELLEHSIRSVRAGGVSWVCVVWQRESSFGESCRRCLEPMLQRLLNAGLVDKLMEYSVQTYGEGQRRRLISGLADYKRDLGCDSVDQLGNQFFCEISKRELGRQLCQAAGCTHFMPLDTDEFYLQDQLAKVWATVRDRGLDGAACRMRYIYRAPTHELLPRDERNWVPILYALRDSKPFRLACPYPGLLVDPCRKLEGVDPNRFLLCGRELCEMWHFSFVRRDIRRKINNVSNRGNYDTAELDAFVRRFVAWAPGQDPPPHPHPYFGALFKTSQEIPNVFEVPAFDRQCSVCLAMGARYCSACKSVRYCGVQCQRADFPRHRKVCRAEAAKRKAAAASTIRGKSTS